MDLDVFVHMRNLTKAEFIHMLRRQSAGFQRGSSRYRGVTLHKCGRWEARMGWFLVKKYGFSILFLLLSKFLFLPNKLKLLCIFMVEINRYVYLGLFDTKVKVARYCRCPIIVLLSVQISPILNIPISYICLWTLIYECVGLLTK